MFADIHHLHQFVSLEQGGSVTATSWVGGTNAGEANIYFGAAHITADNVHKSWLSDDQASDFNAGVNGPIDRNEVMFLSHHNHMLRHLPFKFVNHLSRGYQQYPSSDVYHFFWLHFQGAYNGYAAIKTFWSDTLKTIPAAAMPPASPPRAPRRSPAPTTAPSPASATPPTLAIMQRSHQSLAIRARVHCVQRCTRDAIHPVDFK